MKQTIISLVVLLLLLLLANECRAQNDPTKSFLFLSVFCEPANLSVQYSAQVMDSFCQAYNEFSFECSKSIKLFADPILETLGLSDSLWDMEKYSVQLFRITRSPLAPPYYIMRIQAIYNIEYFGL